MPGVGRRITELDGVRGIAILLVLVWHYVQNQLRPENGSLLAGVRQALGFTWSGVDLFFVLSGFLIAGILIDNRERPGYFRAFYARRVCRIFPLYYLNIAIFLVCMAWLGDRMPVLAPLFRDNGVPLWTYIPFLQNIAMSEANSGGVGWLSVTWSLAVEEQFYLLFPLLVWWVTPSRLPWLFVWFIATAVYLRFFSPGLSAYVNTLWRADALMLGALLAWLVRVPGALDKLERWRGFLLAVLLMAGGAVVIAGAQGVLRLGGAVSHFLLALFYAVLVLYALLSRDGAAGRFFRLPVLVWLGTISFGVYLIHTWVSRLVHALLRGAEPSIHSFSDAGVTVVALLVTLAMAHVSFHWYEKRFIRAGRKVAYG